MNIVRELIKNIAFGVAPGLALRWVRQVRFPEAYVQRYTEDYERSFSLYCRQIEELFPHFDWKGKVVIELGPGPALYTGLLFLTKGVRKVYCVDRFKASQGRLRNMLYDELWRRRSGEERRKLVSVMLQGDDGNWTLNPDHIQYVNRAAEEMQLPQADFICSWAVLEHLSEPDKAIDKIGEHTRPGGLGVHHVDLTGHWLNSADEPLDFLRYPGWLWHLATCFQGAPNRQRLSFHCRALERAGLRIVRLVEKRELPLSVVRRYRGSLALPFSKLSDEDLACLAFICVTQKR